ncbi:MAG: NUDIX hydrolase [Candidatus Aenigmarchaeota archaeon]|nr:NUDIX hydrolase [Candidatus Aenigmarchaeota archaeon]
MNAVALIVHDLHRDHVLIGKKVPYGFLADKWHLPGEKLQPRENELDGIIRCAYEEAGIDVSLARYICTMINDRNSVAWYLCIPDDVNLHPGSDLIEALWVPRKEVPYKCDNEAVALWPKDVMGYFL